jgi:hypothetical protein
VAVVLALRPPLVYPSDTAALEQPGIRHAVVLRKHDAGARLVVVTAARRLEIVAERAVVTIVGSRYLHFGRVDGVSVFL